MKESDLKIGELYKVDEDDVRTGDWYKFYAYRNEIYELIDVNIHNVLLMEKGKLSILINKRDFLNHFTPYSNPINNINKDITIKGIITSKENIIKKVEQDLEKALELFQQEVEKEVNSVNHKKNKVIKMNKGNIAITIFFVFLASLIITYSINYVLFITCILSSPYIIYYCILKIRELEE